MITLTIKGKKYKLPTDGNEVSLLHGMETKKLLNDNLKLKDKRNIISVLTGCSRNDLNDSNKDIVNALFDNLSYFKEGIKPLFHTTMIVNGKPYGIRPIYDMNLGEYIILTTNMKEVDKNLLQISSCLLRPITKKKSSVNHRLNTLAAGFVVRRYNLVNPVYYKSYEVEPNNGEVDNQLLTGISYFYIKQVVNSALAILNEIVKRYPLIYDSGSDKVHALNKQLHKDIYNKYKQNDKNIDSELSEYGLYNLLSTLTKDNKIEIDNWLLKPWSEFLDYAVYMIKKSNIQFKQHKKYMNELRFKNHR